MTDQATPAALPAPCRVQIGKTVYTATATPWEGLPGYPAPGPFFWVLVATKGPRQSKTLFPDWSKNYREGTTTLYSRQNGLSGHGLPKLVQTTFFTGPQG